MNKIIKIYAVAFLTFIMFANAIVINAANDDVPVPKRLKSNVSTINNSAYQNVYDLLRYLNIVDTELGNIKMTAEVTRGYAVKLICKMQVSDVSAAAVKPYADVSLSNDFVNEISEAKNIGIIDKNEEMFYPDKPISLNELSEMLVKALGHEIYVKNSSYYAYARSINLFSGITLMLDNGVTVGELFNIIENALHTNLVGDHEFDSEGSLIYAEIDDGTDYLREKRNIVLQKGIVTAVGYTSYGNSHTLSSNQIEINKQIFDSKQSFDLNLFGKAVFAYVDLTNDEKFVITVWENKKVNEVWNIAGDDLKSVAGNVIEWYDENEKEKTIHIDSSARIIWNDVDYGSMQLAVENELFKDVSKLILIDNDNDDHANIICVYKYEDYVVNIVSSHSKQISFLYGHETIDLSGNEDYVYIEEDGKPIEISELQKYDIATIVSAETKNGEKLYHIIISRNSVTGNLSSISENNYTIGNEEYPLSMAYIDFLKTNMDEFKPQLGEDALFYISTRGEIVASQSLAMYSYGYLLKADKDEGIGEKYKVKIYTTSDSAEVFQLNKTVKFYSTEYLLGINKKASEVYACLINEDGTTQNSLVCYKVTENNEISELALPLTRTSYNPGTIDYPLTKDYICGGTGMIERNRMYFGLINSLFLISSTPVLYVPNGENEKSNEELYSFKGSLANKYSNEYYFQKEIVTLYNAGKFYMPKFVVVETAASSADMLDRFITPVMVCKLSQALSENGEKCLNLSYMEKGQVANRLIRDDVKKVENPTGTKWQGTEGEIAELSTGDIVQFETDNRGVISSIRVLAKYGNYGNYHIQSGDSSSVSEASKANSMIGLTLIYGIVVDREGKTLIVNVSDGGKDELYQYPQFINSTYGNNTYTLLDTNSSKLKVYNASVDEILPGDKVILRKRYNVVCDVFIIR